MKTPRNQMSGNVSAPRSSSSLPAPPKAQNPNEEKPTSGQVRRKSSFKGSLEQSIAKEQKLEAKGTSSAREEALRTAWSKGYLRWKLDDNQRRAYDAIESCDGGSFYLNKARRIGGSYLLCLRALETCLKKPNAEVKYAAPTAKAVRKIIKPNIRKILKDCPRELRPVWNSMDMEYRFPNGSTISIAGCENQNYENLRGTEADEIYVDEAGFIEELTYIIDDVLSPQTQDTDGKIIICSTPPRSPAHESVKIAMDHKAAGRFWGCTVWDNPRRTKEQHIKYFQEKAISKGMDLEQYFESVTFKREYLGEFIADEELSVIPEWNKALESYLVDSAKFHGDYVPKYKDCYVALDVGWKDGMAAVFGYWNYNRQALFIQDEYLVFKKTTDFVADGIRQKEIELWADKEPYLRISDNNLQFIADLNSKGKMSFIPTAKDHKELQINRLREWIRGRKIFIHPRCKRLVTQLASTTWNKNRTSYERTPEGHGDLLDALVYLVRNVRQAKNPHPRGDLEPERHDTLYVETQKQNNIQQKFMDAFGVEEEIYH